MEQPVRIVPNLSLYEDVEMHCELCGQECRNEFGDVGGSIVCSTCLGWYGSEPDPEVRVLQLQSYSRPGRKSCFDPGEKEDETVDDVRCFLRDCEDGEVRRV